MNYQGLDNQSLYKLPEGVSVKLTPAGVAARTYAYMYDFLIRSVIFAAFAFTLSFLGDTGKGITLILYFFISWGYYIFFEAKDGRTPGKKKCHLKVVQDNGLPANTQSIILRNLLRPADSFPFAYVVGIITMAFGKEFKRIGDWAAGTIVVHEHQAKHSELPKKLDARAPALILSTEEQKYIIEFAERSSLLSNERQIELANILSEKLKLEDEDAKNKLNEMAHFYVGQEV